MVTVKKEISKEFYDKCVDIPKKDCWEVVGDFLGMAITAGYGLYGFNFIEDKGKYYLVYDRGSTCD